jgi:chromosome segregation ATPase
LTSLDEYLEATDTGRECRISLELARMRESGKLECRQKLKEAYTYVKELLESEMREPNEKRDELQSRLTDMRRELAMHEKRIEELRGNKFLALRSRSENENALAELNALQSSLAQSQAGESEVQEKQEVSVMREFSVSDSYNDKSSLSSLEMEKEMMSNIKVKANTLGGGGILSGNFNFP